MAVVLTKPGVEFAVIAPAGFHILWALEEIARSGPMDITITSGTDGEHSGPDDPHHHGTAYDIRCHDMPDPAIFLQDLQHLLGTGQFFSFIEDEGSTNQHIHVQLRRGSTYP